MDTKRLDYGFELKNLDENTGEIEGFGSTFGNVDRGGDIVEKGAFLDSLRNHEANGTMPAMFFNHDSNEPIGEWMQATETEKGLYLKGKLWIDGQPVQKAVQALRMAKSTGMKGLSIGFSIPPDGSEFDENGIRRIKKVKLFEISLVPIPMNAEAQLTAVKSLVDSNGEIEDKRTFERALRDLGLTKNQAVGFVAKGYSALTGDPSEQKTGEPESLRSISDALNSALTKLKGTQK